jgi:hypothetical protein
MHATAEARRPRLDGNAAAYKQMNGHGNGIHQCLEFERTHRLRR